MRQSSSKKNNFRPSKLKYVTLRDGVFQFERRVPKAVIDRPLEFAAVFNGKVLFRKSLRTKDMGEAFGPLAAANDEFNALVARALGTAPPVRLTPQTLRKVTQADLDAIVARYRDIVAKPFERAHIMAGVSTAHADELDRMTAELEMFAAEISAEVASNQPSRPSAPVRSPIDMAEDAIGFGGFDAPVGSTERGAVVAAVRTGLRQGYDRVEALNSGKAVITLGERPAAKARTHQLTLRQAVERHQEFKQVHAKLRSEAQLALKTFEGLVGNKYLSDLKRSDFQAFVKSLSTEKVGAKDQKATARCLSLRTIKKRLGIFTASINLAIDRGDFEGPNPAAGFKLSAWAAPVDKSVMPDKRPFKVSELNKVFQHPWFTGCASPKRIHEAGSHILDSMEYWVPVVALYTGCRAAELAGLKLSEIFDDIECPHIVIRDNEHRRTKGAYARNVPILDALVDLGFLEYVERCRCAGHDRLFPDWKPKMSRDGKIFDRTDAAWSNFQVLRAFNRTVIPNMLGDILPADARQEVTFHNLRSSFKTMLSVSQPSINPNIIHDVAGHAKTGMDARYIGKMAIEDTYRAVHKCRYEGLVVPSRRALPQS